MIDLLKIDLSIFNLSEVSLPESCNCKYKRTVHKNPVYDNDGVEVSYDLYCARCGAFLVHID